MPGHIQYTASLYYYPVLCEHGKKGVLCPFPPLGETLIRLSVKRCSVSSFPFQLQANRGREGGGGGGWGPSWGGRSDSSGSPSCEGE